MRRSSRLAVLLRAASDVVPHLSKPAHWKQGRSAKALADSWFGRSDMPPAVRAVLTQSPALAEAELLDGWLERETDLVDGRSTPTQTDLLALLGAGDELVVLAVEAKVDESFGPLVADWLAKAGAGRLQRLTALRALLGLEHAAVEGLRYQLFHRTAAALLEARRFRARTAVLLVQSFCPKATGLADARAFFEAMGLAGLAPGRLVGPVTLDGIALFVGWAADEPPAAIAPEERLT